MDNLDRMFRHLVRTVRAKHPQYLSQPFDVAELNQTILPYRHHRRELGLDTNEDYEITLTELLSGARDYLIVDDRLPLGFVLARQPSRRLRIRATGQSAVIPRVPMLPVWLFVPLDAAPWLTAAAVSALLGAVVERWLFFAEARHLVTLYY